MTQFLFVEDAFSEFYELIKTNPGIVSPQDLNPCFSFYDKISLGEKLTSNQGNYLLKILSKYKGYAAKFNLNYDSVLENVVWKNSFRVIDLSKSVYIETTENSVEVCLKFPFSLKSAFENEIEKTPSISRWDVDRKVRVIELNKCNVIQLYEFCCAHGFEIDESFMSVVSQVEEIWNNQDSITFYSEVDDEVILKNAPESATEYYENNKTTDIEKNMFLAKCMGYPVRLGKIPSTNFEKICTTSERFFWLKSMTDLFEVYSKVGGIIAILLDRNTADLTDWIGDFVSISDKYVSREFVKVCFREENTKNSSLNTWIKDSGLGGKVENGKVLIFHHKPPKWLFTKNIDVKIVVTNSYTPLNEPVSTAWINNHPCVVYVGNIKPTPTRNQQFVNL